MFKMSACSRGILLRQMRLSTQLPFTRLCTTPSNIRHLTISHVLRATKAALPKKPSFTALQKPSTKFPQTYTNFATTLAQKPHPTLLYQAPSHGNYYLASYTGAAFCLFYAGYNFQSFCLHPPPGLSTWVPVAFGGICFLMAVLGGWLALAPARLVRSITAYPTQARAAGQPVGLRIDVELRKMFPLPLMPRRVLTTSPSELTLPHALGTRGPMQRKLSTEETLALKLAREEEIRIEETRVMTRPFRHASRAFHQLFKAVSRTWTRDGFVKLGIRGQTYKVDVTGGWALDQGKALDRLATIKRS